MAYKRTGFANWIDYDQEIDTIKYGDWTFNPEALGLKREKTAFDPKSINTMDDVFRSLGANDKQIKDYNTRKNSIFGSINNGKPNPIFTGADAYKNGVATDIYNLAKDIKPQPVNNGIMGMGGMNSAIGGTPNGASGFNGQSQSTDSMRDMGGIFSPKKPKTYSRVKKGEDGLIYLERGDEIPDTQAFAQSVSDMAWSMYNDGTGADMRHGKDPNSKKESPMRGKAPTQGLLA